MQQGVQSESVNLAGYKLGDILPDGSIVFHVDVSGKHGLAVKAVDEANKLNWDAAIAAASRYGLGWRLPTKDELNLLYQQKTIKVHFDGNLPGGYGKCYWSSTEGSNTGASYQIFNDGSQYGDVKSHTLSVRAVRAF